jgi:hypothetical protein
VFLHQNVILSIMAQIITDYNKLNNPAIIKLYNMPKLAIESSPALDYKNLVNGRTSGKIIPDGNF